MIAGSVRDTSSISLGHQLLSGAEARSSPKRTGGSVGSGSFDSEERYAVTCQAVALC